LVEGQLTVDASDPALFTYVTFDDGGSELTVADPSTSTDWDIAFRRFSAKLNGGVAGPGDVAGANLMNNAAADSATVVDFTPADADIAWDAVTAADIAGATFVQDGIVEDVSGPWFQFSPIAGNLVANPGAAWKAAEHGGGHAVFRVVDMTMNGFTSVADMTIEFRHQDGGDLGALDSVFVDREFVGHAPVEVRELSPGPHRLNVSAEGYEMYAVEIEGGGAPRDVAVRFRVVRLDQSVAVKHKRMFGASQGTLSAQPDGLRFVSEKAEDSFAVGFDEQKANALRGRVGSGPAGDDGEVALDAVRYEYFLPVDVEGVTVLDRPRLDVLEVAAAAWLGHRQRSDILADDHLGQPFAFDRLVLAVHDVGRDDFGMHHEGAARPACASPSEFLDDDGVNKV